MDILANKFNDKLIELINSASRELTLSKNKFKKIKKTQSLDG